MSRKTSFFPAPARPASDGDARRGTDARRPDRTERKRAPSAHGRGARVRSGEPAARVLRPAAWGAPQTLEFAQLQHQIEQRRYAQRYPSAQHGVLLVDGACAGQWRVQRGRRELVLVDIALLERFRGRGIE